MTRGIWTGIAFVAVCAALVVSLLWGFGLQARLDDVPGDGPQPSQPVAQPSVPPSGTPLPTGSGTATPSPSGPAEVDGAVWYPSTNAEAFALVAAANSTPENRARADYVVSGSADDEINAALAELADVQGGQVTLLEGRFELDAPIVIGGNGVALVGSNVGNGAGYSTEALGSQIVPSDSFPEGEFLLATSADAYGPMISLVHVDGLDRAQGINVLSRRPTITLNAVTQSSGTGIRFAGESTGNRPYDGFVLFNRVFDGAGIGIHNDDRSGDMLIEGNIVFRNGGDGMVCQGASEMYRVNHVYNNGGLGLRIIPGCVRTRLSSNKWEGNAAGGVSIEGGSAFTIVGDTFAHNENDQAGAGAHLQVGVRGEVETSGVMLWGLAFGKGSDDNPNLIHVGSLGKDVHIGPLHSAGGSTGDPVRVDPGGEALFYESVPEVVLE